MKKTSGNISQDPSFNTISVRRIRSAGTNGIEILSDVQLRKPSALSVSQLKILHETEDINTSFVLDIDEGNPNTLVIRKLENETVIDTGILYDTQFNKPEGGSVLYISPIFSLPAEVQEAKDYILANPSKLLVVECTEPTTISVPSLKTTGEDDCKQIRISNISLFPLVIQHLNTTVIEMFQERVSIVWCQRGGIYSWMYVA